MCIFLTIGEGEMAECGCVIGAVFRFFGLSIWSFVNSSYLLLVADFCFSGLKGNLCLLL